MPGGAVIEQPLLLQPVWITVIVQILTLLVAAGVSYGLTKAKLSTNEREITALKKDVAKIQLDFQKWQRERLPSVVKTVDCHNMQADCKSSICRKIDNLGMKLDEFTKAEQKKDHQLALVIGAVCQKLDIHLPELR